MSLRLTGPRSRLLVALALLALSCAGCGGRGSPTIPHPSDTPASRKYDTSSGESANASCRDTYVSSASNPAGASGYLVLPSHPDGSRVAAVVAIHGGLAETAVGGQQQTHAYAEEVSSHLCNTGIAVFSVDYPWSDIGGAELRATAAAFDYLRSRQDIDASRIAVLGSSSGGYKAMMAAAAPPYARPFAAVVNLYGFVSAASEIQDEPWNTQAALTRQTLGSPLSNPSQYATRSVLTYLAGLHAPLLVVVGATDRLLPELKSLTRSLATMGRNARLDVVAGAGHYFEVRPAAEASMLWSDTTTFLTSSLKKGT